MRAVQRLGNSVRKRGIFGTSWIALRKLGVVFGTIGDRWFDIRYGTDTVGIVELKELDIASDNKPFGMRYEVTRARLFRKLLETVDLPTESTLVDIGSGKGRVLMLAAQHGFRKVVGVEFSRELCETARKNLAVFQDRIGRTLNVEILEMDVADYDVRSDESVFFLFNPFDAGIMELVLDNITRSLDESPRPVWLIYQYPECRAAIDGYGGFTETAAYHWGGRDFIVYRNESDSRAR